MDYKTTDRSLDLMAMSICGFTDYDPSTGKDLDMGEEGTLLLVVKSDSSPPGTYLLSKDGAVPPGGVFSPIIQNIQPLDSGELRQLIRAH